MILKNKTLILSAILLTFLVLFNIGLSIHITKEADYLMDLIWISIIFSGLIIVCAALFHRVGIEDGKMEGFLSDWKPSL